MIDTPLKAGIALFFCFWFALTMNLISIVRFPFEGVPEGERRIQRVDWDGILKLTACLFLAVYGVTFLWASR